MTGGEPLDENAIKAEARLLAIEHLLANLFRIVYEQAGMTDAGVEAINRMARLQLDKETFPGADPALADLWAAEIRDAVTKLLSLISEMRLEVKTPKKPAPRPPGGNG